MSSSAYCAGTTHSPAALQTGPFPPWLLRIQSTPSAPPAWGRGSCLPNQTHLLTLGVVFQLAVHLRSLGRHLGPCRSTETCTRSDRDQVKLSVSLRTTRHSPHTHEVEAELIWIGRDRQNAQWVDVISELKLLKSGRRAQLGIPGPAAGSGRVHCTTQ